MSSTTESFLPSSSHIALNCVAGLRAATGFSAGCGASLVDAVLDRTLGVSNSVGFNWVLSLIGHSGCVVR